MGKRSGGGNASSSSGSEDVIRGKLRAEFSKLQVTRPFPGLESKSALHSYTGLMISDLSKIYKEVDDGQLISELLTATDESQWLNILLKSLPVSGVEAVKVEGDVEEDQLRTEFERQYQDPGGKIVSYVLHHTDLCYKNWCKERGFWYAPCTAIVQSSGWGKSRLIREIAFAPNQVTVFYFSLMDPNRSGYPRSNTEIRSYFENIRAVEDAYAIFAACFKWLSSQQVFPSKKKLFRKHQRKQYEDILDRIRSQQNCSKESMIKECTDAVCKHKESLRNDGVSFLFVLDEARTLLKTAKENSELPFVLFRRACADLPQDARSFVLFIDTTSKVLNFTPSQRYDPSLRVVRGLCNLFAPICRIPTFDLLPLSTPSPRSLDHIASPQILFTQGRPLWASRVFHGQDWATEILNLAQTKLLGGYYPFSLQGQQKLESLSMPLVLLGRRIGVDVCPQSHFAEEIVASHMGICLHVSTSREYVLCTSLPEPVLSEAAASLLRRNRPLLLSQLCRLNALLLNGIASSGERGELVVRFLLINAMDALQDPDSPTRPVYLRKFLKALFPRFHGGFSGVLRHLKQAKVFFNAFHRFYGKPSLHHVRVFLKKGAAITCEKNQAAFDLYIPYVLPDEHGEYNVEDDNLLGCVAIQVKNRQEIRDVRSTAEDMAAYTRQIALSGSDEVIAAFLILLHVGADTAKNPSELRLPLDNVFLVEGLDEVSIPSDLEEVIKVLLCETPDPLTIFAAEKEGEKKHPVYKRMVTDEAVNRETDALKSILASVWRDTQSKRVRGIKRAGSFIKHPPKKMKF